MLVSSQAPSAQQAAAAAPVPAAVAKPAKPKLICKADDDDTGSRIVKRTCLTQQEWDARVQGRSFEELRSTAQTAH
jgi:hypothetical protein